MMNNLPPEIQLQILGYTSIWDIIRFSRSNKQCGKLICDDFMKLVDLWHYRIISLAYSPDAYKKINKTDFVTFLCELDRTKSVGIFLNYLKPIVKSTTFIQFCFMGNSVETFLYLKTKLEIDWNDVSAYVNDAFGNRQITLEIFKIPEIDLSYQCYSLIHTTVVRDDSDYLDFIMNHTSLWECPDETIYNFAINYKSINCLIWLWNSGYDVDGEYISSYDILECVGRDINKLDKLLRTDIYDSDNTIEYVLDLVDFSDRDTLKKFLKYINFDAVELQAIIRHVDPFNAEMFYNKLKTLV